MPDNKEKSRTLYMMIVMSVIVFLMLVAVVIGFQMLHRNYDAMAYSSSATEGNRKTGKAKKKAGNAADDQGEELSAYDAEASEKIYLIKGDQSGSNRYDKVDHLSYTDSVKYTEENLALLDSDGLRITRNEVFARHGRMFNDQNLQEYFSKKKWYVPKYSAQDFDDSLLNEVEQYNVNLIRSYELSRGFNADLTR